MKRIAFWYDSPTSYSGGINYYKNLLYALKELRTNKIETVFYFGKKVDDSIIKEFQEFSNVKTTSALDRKSLLWFIDKVCRKILSFPIVMNFIFLRDKINILSHCKVASKVKLGYKDIIWIPDFQAVHLPHLFPNFDLDVFRSTIRNNVSDATAVVLSSYDAKDDLVDLVSKDDPKFKVLQFVSQPNSRIFKIDTKASQKVLEDKYGIGEKYFYLPNQFWQHKNHLIAFEAVKILKEKGLSVQIVCTGNPVDFRTNTTDYYDNVCQYVIDEKLENEIKCLGFIDYDEVLSLFRNSVAIINPSLFEGWSSTVEEARSIGKRQILSDLNVHMEQNPPGTVFFSAKSSSDLAEKMKNYWEDYDSGIDIDMETNAKLSLSERTKAYAENYISIVTSI